MTLRRPSRVAGVIRANLQWLCFLLVGVAGLLVLTGIDARHVAPDASLERPGGPTSGPAAEIEYTPLASPHAAVVVAALPGAGQLVARQAPDASSPVVEIFDVDPEQPSHFLATASYRDLQTSWAELSSDGRWIEVYLPIRPNESTGWVELTDVELFQNRYSIRVNRESFLLEVFEDGEVVLEAEVAVGAEGTQTPAGTFFTEELIRVPDATGPYGPFAFVLSGYSEHLFSFNGGPGLIGIHGTNDSSSLGGQASHGCIRVDNTTIAELAEFIPLATPIEII